MSDVISVGVHVLALTQSGAQVCPVSSTGWPFWVSRTKGVAWAMPLEVGKPQVMCISRWAAKFHKQLSSAVNYEQRARADYARPVECVTSSTSSTQIAKESEVMNDTSKPEDSGHGALFKNLKKEKPSQPGYVGDCTIKGRKFWMSASIKEGSKGKYMSLAFRQAEDEKPAAKPAAKVSAAAGNSDEIPFAPEVR